ncbi:MULTISPECIES: LppU/SCO3897 family protein [Kitasatospora]|uniref:Serine/threonine protein kinase n=1 Tax=Kitasatospora cathayae TaxID=3004092 RepID=A0ABY7Q5D0_9ACTN|nr:hypothetical protein [Kitasatospora sp. HUAS 3-15]WBP87874.1 hypothetical protein O1G21_19855 [Kitasatospora sp. HUAS 3-15]
MSTPTGPYGPPPPAAPGYGPPPPAYGRQPYPPNPYAQNPYAQNPYAQAPQAQQPYGQQPPAGPYGYPQPAQPPAAPPAKRGVRSKLRVVGVVGGCVVVAAGYFLSGPNVSSAKPGDCVRVSGSRDVEIVNCTDSKANYKVLSKFTGTTDVTRCRQTPQTTSTVSGKSGRRWNKKRYVLCLGPLTPTTGYPPVKKS